MAVEMLRESTQRRDESLMVYLITGLTSLPTSALGPQSLYCIQWLKGSIENGESDQFTPRPKILQWCLIDSMGISQDIWQCHGTNLMVPVKAMRIKVPIPTLTTVPSPLLLSCPHHLH